MRKENETRDMRAARVGLGLNAPWKHIYAAEKVQAQHRARKRNQKPLRRFLRWLIGL